ncbi:Histone-lysine N-methyltransferase EZ1 [Vitis vinifera]|uniref:Histone-lysine N-methyltransferase EZ1 n=1 Tax=Vitis vinifera TaxID=29760 RepID=A0A438F6W2_VITVI|nr:Histone-lysine N-methyltransferase EZ1 [Vitis vinifera]
MELQVSNLRYCDALRVARIDLEVAIVPKVSAEVVNVHALRQTGNVIQMFVGIAGSVLVPDEGGAWCCGDGTLGVPSQRGDNYECRNMKLLLKQQQRVIIWLLIVLMTNIAKCSPILAHVCGGWGGEMFSNLEIPCWFLCLFHD